jgi:hypothetical protein
MYICLTGYWGYRAYKFNMYYHLLRRKYDFGLNPFKLRVEMIQKCEEPELMEYTARRNKMLWAIPLIISIALTLTLLLRFVFSLFIELE